MRTQSRNHILIASKMEEIKKLICKFYANLVSFNCEILLLMKLIILLKLLTFFHKNPIVNVNVNFCCINIF